MTLDQIFNQVLARHDELSSMLIDNHNKIDLKNIVRISKEKSELDLIASSIKSFQQLKSEMVDLTNLINDPLVDVEIRDIAEKEFYALKERLPILEHEIKISLLPKDEIDEKNAILEIRAGTGGEEAALFASELFRMYERYSILRGWRFEILVMNDTGLGGIKEATAEIIGRGVFARLKFESGVHRVQRVPQTETSGRIHTSAATVAILPEAKDIDIHIDDRDLRIDVFRSQGAGGQSVNTTDSAIRITHLPTNTVVQCQNEKSQHKNKTQAMKVLRARLYEAERTKKNAERSANRKEQIGSGDRSERIRTYNFPHGRVTDHRINMTIHKIDKVMSGEVLDEFGEALIVADQAIRLTEIK
ncbi:MAG: peptide chain release factor 1 [Rhodospirillaceae bacterium]|jgi:peptide chain release factor 1|nr:peptide chain release factor 1 [Rhodospirillaceae bacterium]